MYVHRLIASAKSIDKFIYGCEKIRKKYIEHVNKIFASYSLQTIACDIYVYISRARDKYIYVCDKNKEKIHRV